MSDLIDRQAAIDAKQEFRNPNVVRDTEARTAYDRTYANGWNDCNSAWINAIKALPSAQPEPCEDAVSRKMAMDAITASTPYCVVPDDYHISVVDMEFRISTLPSVTPKQKTGKWIRNDNNTWSCDQCRSWIPDEQHYYARYCLCCGAKMEEDV